MSRSLKTADILFVIGAGLMTVSHFLTNFFIWKATTIQTISTTAENIAQAYEANPLAVSLVASTNGISMMLQYIIMPAILLAGYYLFRKQWVKVNPPVVVFVAMLIFFMGLLNFLNDLGNLVGFLVSIGGI